MKLAALALLATLCAMSAGRQEMPEGNAASPVRVAIYEDLADYECARLRTMLDDKLLPKYGRRVAFIHRDFPLGKDDWARMAALAGRWVWTQSSSLGVVYRRELYAEQDHITAANLSDWLRQFARRHKLDENGIIAALDNRELGALVDSDLVGGQGRGVTKVPAVFLGSQLFAENVQYEDVAKALDEALGR